jgi:transposase-like protein/predicted transcriptional regulator
MQRHSNTGAPHSTAATAEIIRLYFEERLSLSGVAKRLQIGRHIVEKALKESGVKLRSPRDGARLAFETHGSPRLQLSSEQRGQIVSLLRQFLPSANSGARLAAQVNEMLHLKLLAKTYKRIATEAGLFTEGLVWPSHQVRRFTPEQSEQLNRQIAELHATGHSRKQIAETIGLGYATICQRGRKLGLEWLSTRAGRPRLTSATEYLPQDQVKMCYDDPAYEARNGIADRVICRECCRKALEDRSSRVALFRDGAMDGKRGHIRLIHDLRRKEYDRRNPGAPIFTWRRRADEANQKFISKADERRVTAEQMMAEEVESYLTEEELAAAKLDPEYEDKPGMERYVICREDRCGFKSASPLNKHVWNVHGMKIGPYRRKHNWPNVIPRALRKRKAERAREAQTDLKRRAWRPQDWAGKPIEWRIIGTELLSCDGYMSNEDLGQRLDKSRILICPYGKSWKVALSSDKAKNNKRAVDLTSEIRGWVKKPGKVRGSPKQGSIPPSLPF